MYPLELAFYCAITGAVIAYVGHMWWEDEKQLRKEARWQVRIRNNTIEVFLHGGWKDINTVAVRQAHKMLLSEDTSVEEINAILDKLESHK